jgi:hypothetical protein
MTPTRTRSLGGTEAGPGSVAQSTFPPERNATLPAPPKPERRIKSLRFIEFLPYMEEDLRSGISNLSFTMAPKHTPATLSIQAQITVARRSPELHLSDN